MTFQWTHLWLRFIFLWCWHGLRLWRLSVSLNLAFYYISFLNLQSYFDDDVEITGCSWSKRFWLILKPTTHQPDSRPFSLACPMVLICPCRWTSLLRSLFIDKILMIIFPLQNRPTVETLNPELWNEENNRRSPPHRLSACWEASLFFLFFSAFLLFLSESHLLSSIRDLARQRKCRPLLERIMIRAARWSFWRRRQGWTKSHLASELPASARIMKNIPPQVSERETECVCFCVCVSLLCRRLKYHLFHKRGVLTLLCSGPGSYDLFQTGLAQLGLKQALLAQNRKGGFGSTVRRDFIFHSKELEGPGPAQYEVRETTCVAFLS